MKLRRGLWPLGIVGLLAVCSAVAFSQIGEQVPLSESVARPLLGLDARWVPMPLPQFLLEFTVANRIAVHPVLLRRVLARANVDPHSLRGKTMEEQAGVLRESLVQFGRKLTEEPVPQGSSVRHLVTWKARVDSLTDTAQVLSALGDHGLAKELDQQKALALAELDTLRADLVKRYGERLEAGLLSRWFGRTALMDLEDGSVIAFKRRGENDAENSSRESALMNEAGRWGIDAPVSLSFSEMKVGGQRFQPYLVPARLARGYLQHLDQPLPSVLSRPEKKRQIMNAALKSIDHLILLADNGSYHASLAPLSHSENHWEWDFWRSAGINLNLPRFGPTSLHNWLSGLRFSNLRMSGIADFEHVAAFTLSEHTHATSLWEGQKYSHDGYSSMGQDLSEWAWLVLQAHKVNNLSSFRAASVLTDGIRSHARAFLPPETTALFRWPLVWFSSLSFALRFNLFTFFSDHLPQRLVDLINKRMSAGFLGSSFNLEIPKGEGLAMPGGVPHPFMMNVLRPYITLLRSYNPLSLGQLSRSQQKAEENILDWVGMGVQLFAGLLGFTSIAFFLSLSVLGFFSMLVKIPKVWMFGLPMGACLIWFGRYSLLLAAAVRDRLLPAIRLHRP